MFSIGGGWLPRTTSLRRIVAVVATQTTPIGTDQSGFVTFGLFVASLSICVDMELRSAPDRKVTVLPQQHYVVICLLTSEARDLHRKIDN